MTARDSRRSIGRLRWVVGLTIIRGALTVEVASDVEHGRVLVRLVVLGGTELVGSLSAADAGRLADAVKPADRGGLQRLQAVLRSAASEVTR